MLFKDEKCNGYLHVCCPRCYTRTGTVQNGCQPYCATTHSLTWDKSPTRTQPGHALRSHEYSSYISTVTKPTKEASWSI